MFNVDNDTLRMTIKATVADLIGNRIEASDIADDEVLFSTADASSRIELDSLDGLELIFAVEAATGGTLPSELDPRELATVNMIVELVERLLSTPVLPHPTSQAL